MVPFHCTLLSGNSHGFPSYFWINSHSHTVGLPVLIPISSVQVPMNSWLQWCNWPSRQLLSARKYIVSYRSVSYRTFTVVTRISVDRLLGDGCRS